MKTTRFLPVAALTGTLILATASTRAAENSPWHFDLSVYGLAAGMSGDVAVRGVPVDVDVGFDDIWDNLKFGAMGSARLGYQKWTLSTEVIFMDLETTKNSFTAEAEQWMVQPALEYQVCPHLGLYAGARYNSIDAELNGPIIGNPSGTESWWDPIVGARVSLPLGEKFSFNVTGDVGGFGVGSDLTWQAFPYLNWRFARHASLQAGYRFLYTDYENGSGATYFKYDILSSGPQLGVTFHF